jgi:hypothetical protein
VLALEIAVAAAVLVGVAFLASRGVAGLEDEPTDRADIGLPEGRPVHSDDIAHLRLRTVSAFWGGFRGYRFEDVDTVLARVEDTLRGHEAQPAPESPVMRRGQARPPLNPDE